MKFSHKILLTASLVVSGALLTFTLLNDLAQGEKTEADIQSDLNSSSRSTARIGLRAVVWNSLEMSVVSPIA